MGGEREGLEGLHGESLLLIHELWLEATLLLKLLYLLRCQLLRSGEAEALAQPWLPGNELWLSQESRLLGHEYRLLAESWLLSECRLLSKDRLLSESWLLPECRLLPKDGLLSKRWLLAKGGLLAERWLLPKGGLLAEHWMELADLVFLLVILLIFTKLRLPLASCKLRRPLAKLWPSLGKLRTLAKS